MSETAERPDPEDVVEEHRKTFELVADGDDEPAEFAEAWLREIDNAE
jgi:hypothetical protein